MWKRLFGRNKEGGAELEVAIPKEAPMVVEWTEDGLPCVAVLNSALRGFEPKQAFSWHLSLIIDYEELMENGMPTMEENAIVDPFCERLDAEIKTGGNALLVIRETWNGTRRLVWRVNSPEVAHGYLQGLLEQGRYPRPFDYQMEQDSDWTQVKWYFERLGTP